MTESLGCSGAKSAQLRGGFVGFKIQFFVIEKLLDKLDLSLLKVLAFFFLLMLFLRRVSGRNHAAMVGVESLGRLRLSLLGAVEQSMRNGVRLRVVAETRLTIHQAGRVLLLRLTRVEHRENIVLERAN